MSTRFNCHMLLATPFPSVAETRRYPIFLYTDCASNVVLGANLTSTRRGAAAWHSPKIWRHASRPVAVPLSLWNDVGRIYGDKLVWGKIRQGTTPCLSYTDSLQKLSHSLHTCNLYGGRRGYQRIGIVCGLACPIQHNSSVTVHDM